MNIITTQFNLNQSALEIYIAGCDRTPHCGGCHNPESWDFSVGKRFDKPFKKYLRNKIKRHNNLINSFWVLGGEPLDNNIEPLLSLLEEYHKGIWLFTSYKLREIDQSILSRLEYIKTGRYNKKQKSDNYYQYGVKLSTTNQKIHNLTGSE